MSKLLLFQIYRTKGSTPEETTQATQLLYASTFLTEKDWEGIIELAQDRINDIHACKPRGEKDQ
jgi:hypothetical protein